MTRHILTDANNQRVYAGTFQDCLTVLKMMVSASGTISNGDDRLTFIYREGKVVLHSRQSEQEYFDQKITVDALREFLATKKR